MEIKQSLKIAVKSIFNLFNLELVRINKNQTRALCGLSNLPIKTIIDVGANTGQFARHITKIYKDAHIYCFEPLKEPYETLKIWAEAQKGRASTFNMAIGDEKGEINMFHHIEHCPSSSILNSTEICEDYYPFTGKQRRIKVQLTTLDHALSKAINFMDLDILVKFDVQGFEDRAIRGGRETLNKAVACIVEISLDRLYRDQADFKDLIIMLDEMGFRYAGNLDQVYADDGHVIYLDALFIKRNKITG